MTQEPEKSAPSLASLEEKLSALKETQTPRSSEAEAGKRAAYRAASDFAAATVVGSALGYGADYLLATRPLGLIVGMIIGVVTGFRMMMQAMK